MFASCLSPIHLTVHLTAPPDCPCQCRQSVEELWEKVVERDAFNKAFLTVWENAGLDAMLGPGGVRAKQHYVLEY